MEDFKKLLLLVTLGLNVLSAKDSFAIAAAARARQTAEQAAIQQRQRENYEDELMIRVENMVDTKIENALKPVLERLDILENSVNERFYNLWMKIESNEATLNGKMNNLNVKIDNLEQKLDQILNNIIEGL